MKLIISDLDGTLLMQGERALPNALFRLISELKQHGIAFAVASGRPYIELKKFFAPALYDMYFICENGAVVLYQGKVLRKSPLPIYKSDREIVRAFSEELGSLALAGTHTIYTIQDNPMVSEYYKEKGLSIMKLRSLQSLPEECLRLSVCRRSQQTTEAALIENIRKYIGKDVHIIYEDEKWIDIVAKDVNKGNTVRWLQDTLKTTKNETLVFGDNVNDKELFETSAHSYAMEWASDDVKTRAKYTTDCVISAIRGYI